METFETNNKPIGRSLKAVFNKRNLAEGAPKSKEVAGKIAEIIENYAGYIIEDPEIEGNLKHKMINEIKNINPKIIFTENTFKNVSAILAKYTGGTDNLGAKINELMSMVAQDYFPEERPEGGYIRFSIEDKEDPEMKINRSFK